MSDFILAKRIFEGLVHNLNTPLNIVLGFSSRLKKKHPELIEAERIYNAALEMDRQLKELTEHLYQRSFATRQEIDLIKWLDLELSFLYQHLPIKHNISFNVEHRVQGAVIMAAPFALSLWYEDVIRKFLGFGRPIGIKTGIMLYQDSFVIYLAPEAFIDEEFKALLLKPIDNSLIADGNLGVLPGWLDEANSLIGVLR